MGENFIKFKKRAFKIRLFKSVIGGVSLGCFAAGLLILLRKLELIGLSPVLSAVIAAFAAALLGGALFLLLRVSDTQLARRLDSELSLQERVETMLEYRNEHSAIYELQREDASERLSEASPKILKPRRLWLYISAFAVGVAMLVVSLVFSLPPEEEPPVVDEEFKITELQIKATNELIASVEASAMASPYRENTVRILTDMLDSLKVTETVREKDAAVKDAMEKILTETDNSSSAVELMNALWSANTDGGQALAKALNYYDWPTLDEWDKFQTALTNLRSVFVHSDAAAEAPDESKINTETEILLLKTSSTITGALTRSGISSSDALYSVLTRLAAANEENSDGTRVYGFEKLSELVSVSGYTSVQRELDATLTAVSGELFSALSVHKENTDTGENAIKRIGDIFDLEPVKFERPSFVEISGEGEAPGSDDENKGGGGAIGSGTEYGSDDLVLDPYTNTYVEYGVIIERYYALMFGGLESGGYTDAQKDAMEKYFAILYGGFEKGEKTDE